MTRIQCNALLFDMDGVLINSTPAVARVWRKWAIERGFNPEEVVRRAHGRPSMATIREYLPDSDHEAENREMERREIADLDGVMPLPGAAELLHSLPPDRWAIVTSSTRPLAEVRLKTAGIPLPANFVTSNDVVNGKPAPDPYLKGAERLGFAPSDCVVVEDVPAGIQSGKSAGCQVIGLTTSVSPEGLSQAGADWILKSCGDISRAAGLIDGKLQLELGENKAKQN